jgi:hypothetical protein
LGGTKSEFKAYVLIGKYSIGEKPTENVERKQFCAASFGYCDSSNKKPGSCSSDIATYLKIFRAADCDNSNTQPVS